MDRSEKLLRALFDFQRFQKNERLEKIVRTEDMGVPLDDSDLELNAAGENETWRAETGGDEKP